MENIGTDQNGWAERLSKRLGDAIAARRKEINMTASALADRCSEMGHPIHRVTLSKIEKGRSSFDLAELLVLAAALETSPVALMYAGHLVDAPVEVLPDRAVPAIHAVEWFAGEAPLDRDRSEPQSGFIPLAAARGVAEARENVVEVEKRLDGSQDSEAAHAAALRTVRGRELVAQALGLTVGSDA